MHDGVIALGDPFTVLGIPGPVDGNNQATGVVGVIGLGPVGCQVASFLATTTAIGNQELRLGYIPVIDRFAILGFLIPTGGIEFSAQHPVDEDVTGNRML